MLGFGKKKPEKSAKETKSSLDLVNKTKKNLKRYRSQFEKNWKEEEDAYHGKIWKNQDGYRPYENHMFQVVEGEVPILTDSYPSTSIKVDDDAYLEQAQSLDKAVQWVFENQDFQLKLPMVIRDSLISAPGFIHIYYDANEDDGNGEIQFEIVPWKKVFLHGGSLFLEKCEAARIELTRSRTWLKLNYPNYAEKVERAKAEGVDKDGDDEGRETQDTGTNYAKRQPPKEYKDDDTLVLVKTFIKDYSIEPIPEEETLKQIEDERKSLSEGEGMDVAKWQDHSAHIESHLQDLTELYGQLGLSPEVGFDAAAEAAEAIAQESGGEADAGLDEALLQIRILENHIEEHKVLSKENKKGGRLKYKNGLRCIETLNDIVLYDGPSRDDHAEIPLIPFYCYRDGTIYGHGEIRHILDSQRMQAVLLYKEYKGAQRVLNPSIIIDKESGLTENDVSNEDGAIYVVEQGTQGPRHMDPGQISPQISPFNEARKRAISDISGINEVTQGKVPNPQASGVTVTKTQQQAIGRIRLKERQNERYSIKRLGRLAAALVIQHWTEERTLKLEDKGGNYEQVVFNPLDMVDLKYEVTIAEGSMAGIDKDSYNALLLNFLNGGQITFNEFLEVAEIPRAEKLLSFVKERMNIQGQLEQTQKQLIEFKGATNPELLTPEEAQVFEEIQRQKLLEQQQGVNPDQP